MPSAVGCLATPLLSPPPTLPNGHCRNDAIGPTANAGHGHFAEGTLSEGGYASVICSFGDAAPFTPAESFWLWLSSGGNVAILPCAPFRQGRRFALATLDAGRAARVFPRHFTHHDVLALLLALLLAGRYEELVRNVFAAHHPDAIRRRKAKAALYIGPFDRGGTGERTIPAMHANELPKKVPSVWLPLGHLQSSAERRA